MWKKKSLLFPHIMYTCKWEIAYICIRNTFHDEAGTEKPIHGIRGQRCDLNGGFMKNILNPGFFLWLSTSEVLCQKLSAWLSLFWSAFLWLLTLLLFDHASFTNATDSHGQWAFHSKAYVPIIYSQIKRVKGTDIIGVHLLH